MPHLKHYVGSGVISEMMSTNMRYPVLSALVIIILATATFAPCLRGTFVFDDIPAVIENKNVYSERANLSSAFFHDFWGELATSNKSHGSYRPLMTILFREH